MRWKNSSLLLAIIVSAVFVGACQRDPRLTQLPFGTTDLGSVQASLDKLPPADRDLVVAYVKRSRGDVLPEQFADPDEPLTARNFADAIKLQREFVKRRAAEQEKAEVRLAAREDQLMPLREALSLTLVAREILPREQVLGLAGRGEAAPGGVKRAIDSREILVTTYRLRNTSSERIESATGSVTIRKAHRGESEIGVLDSCFIDHRQAFASGESVEVRCSKTNVAASDAARNYVAMSEEELSIEWEPRTVRFGDGTALTFRN